MGKNSLIVGHNSRLRNSVNVIRGHRFIAEYNMALRANERAVPVSLIDLVVENSTFIRRRGNMATFGATTGFHRHSSRLVRRSVHRRHVVTLRAFQIGMCFMSKRTG